jgi:hypothetical protein
VLESGDVVGGGLDAQDEGKFVVDLDRGFSKAMLDAGALDPGCELTGDLLGELGSDLVAKEGRYVFGPRFRSSSLSDWSLANRRTERRFCVASAGGEESERGEGEGREQDAL